MQNENDNDNNAKRFKLTSMETLRAKRYDDKMSRRPATVIIGSQWGDEGKGKLVDDLGQKYDIVCRFAGGSNAGHTIVKDGTTYKFHSIPSGIVNPQVTCVIGNGLVINIEEMSKEMDELVASGIADAWSRVVISDRAHLVLDAHKQIDKFNEIARGGDKLGTTLKGIGPCYKDKASRDGLRFADLLDFARFKELYEKTYERLKKIYPDLVVPADELTFIEAKLESIRPMIKNTVSYLHDAMHKNRKRVLVEGANAGLLDLDFGTYPYVTSSNCTVGGACTGLGIPANDIGDVIGIAKAYLTRVGAGPFPTELTDDIGVHMQTVGHEVGTTTGRTRRCGWFDAVGFAHVAKINGFTEINLTKLDVLSKLAEIKVAVAYKHKGQPLADFPTDLKVLGEVEVEYFTFPGWEEDISDARRFDDLPENARRYVECLEEIIEVPIKYIGVGPDRDATIIRNK